MIATAGEGRKGKRFLSISVQLSGEESYEGGQLQVGSFDATRRLGAAVVFPSWALHKVRPVLSGIRVSLVGWIRGFDRDRFWPDAGKSYRSLMGGLDLSAPPPPGEQPVPGFCNPNALSGAHTATSTFDGLTYVIVNPRRAHRPEMTKYAFCLYLFGMLLCCGSPGVPQNRS